MDLMDPKTTEDHLARWAALAFALVFYAVVAISTGAMLYFIAQHLF